MAYDLDRFRRLILEPAFLQAYGPEVAALSDPEGDDAALLWVSYRVLPTILSREGARALTGIIRSSKNFFAPA